MPPIAVIIRGRLSALGKRQVDLGIELGHTSEVMVAHVLAGRKAIPPAEIDRWADALKLSGSERSEFWWEAARGSIHSSILPSIDRVLSEHAALKEITKNTLMATMPEIEMSDLDDLFAELHDHEKTKQKWIRIARKLRKARDA